MDEYDIRAVRALSGCTRDEAIEALTKTRDHIGFAVKYIGITRKAKREEVSSNGTVTNCRIHVKDCGEG